MYEIIISHEAEKQYRRFDKNTKKKINKSIGSLRMNPLKNKQVKKLRGKLEGKYRSAIGKIRIVFEVDLENNIVRITSIKSRGDVYKMNILIT